VVGCSTNRNAPPEEATQPSAQPPREIVSANRACSSRAACQRLAREILEELGAMVDTTPYEPLQEPPPRSEGQPQPSQGELGSEVGSDLDSDAAELLAAAAPECVFAASPGAPSTSPRGPDRPPSTLIGSMYEGELNHLALQWGHPRPKVRENDTIAHAF